MLSVAVVHFRCHHLEIGGRDVPDGVDFERIWDCQLCHRIGVGATGEGINPDRVVPEEGSGRSEDLFESRVNAVRHILVSNSEVVPQKL